MSRRVAILRPVALAGLLTALLTACGGAAAVSQAPTSASAQSGAVPTGATEAAAPSSSGSEAGALTPAPVPGRSPRATPVPQTYGSPGETAPFVGTAPSGASAELAQWESQLDQGQRELAASGGACRDICRAAANICVASREICALTGDGASDAPRDERCARGRTSCIQASAQREAACPVCPQ